MSKIGMIIKNNNFLFNHLKRFQNRQAIKRLKKVSPEQAISSKWMEKFGYPLNTENPSTLNEKIQWLKLNYHDPIFTTLCDKYESRKYFEEHFGKEYLIPLLFMTRNIKDINPKNITEFPCIIKCSSGSGMYKILYTSKINWRQLRRDCKTWLKCNYYAKNFEWQYKDQKPCIIVERLLHTDDGKLPSDYKLNFFNGKLEFIYTSNDRTGDNYRQIFDVNWNRLKFDWSGKQHLDTTHPDLPKPVNLEDMVRIGSHFAQLSPYIRVDFFDVDGKIYIGEITLHHGSGFYKFYPEEYDKIYGDKLILPIK